jgi:hypothetical protein
MFEEMNLERDRAEKVSTLSLRISDDLNSLLIELIEDADSEATAQYKQLIGAMLGEIYCSILRPVYRHHPDIAPDELKTGR